MRYSIDLFEEIIAGMERGWPVAESSDAALASAEPQLGEKRPPGAESPLSAEGPTGDEHPTARIKRVMADVRTKAASVPQPPTGAERLGRYLRRARRLLRLSQAALSWQTGVPQSSLSRFELGRGGGMRVERLALIGDALGSAFPLGYCPHHHRCPLQPIKPPAPLTDDEVFREQLVALALDGAYWTRPDD